MIPLMKYKLQKILFSQFQQSCRIHEHKNNLSLWFEETTKRNEHSFYKEYLLKNESPVPRNSKTAALNEEMI